MENRCSLLVNRFSVRVDPNYFAFVTPFYVCWRFGFQVVLVAVEKWNIFGNQANDNIENASNAPTRQLNAERKTSVTHDVSNRRCHNLQFAVRNFYLL